MINQIGCKNLNPNNLPNKTQEQEEEIEAIDKREIIMD